MTNGSDVIVVGLGAMGSAVAFQAQQLGLSVLGIDKYDPPHTMGSSHAETRITRLAVGEGPQYLPFVARAHEIWRELAERTGEQLLYQTGGLIITSAISSGDRWNDFAVETDRIAAAAAIEFDLLDPAEAMARYPNLTIESGSRVGFEPTGGVVLTERAVAVQIAQARILGATIATNETVTAIDPGPTDVRVTTNKGAYLASQVVLATGPWFHDLAATTLANQIEVTRQTVMWFEADDLESVSTDRFPTILWIGDTIEDYIGVFPRPPGGTPGLKIVAEQFTHTTTPDAVERTVSPAEIDTVYERNVAHRISGLQPRCVRAEVCLYTNTADDHFLIDTHPASDRVLAMSPCSGHGFKHSAALGEAVAQRLATGASTLDLSPFSLASLRQRRSSPVSQPPETV